MVPNQAFRWASTSGMGELLGQEGEAAQIGEPDRRLDQLDGATIHLALEDTLSRVGTHIGVEQVDRDAAQDVSLHVRAEKPCGEFQPVECCRVKALRPPGGEGDHGGPGADPGTAGDT